MNKDLKSKSFPPNLSADDGLDITEKAGINDFVKSLSKKEDIDEQPTKQPKPRIQSAFTKPTGKTVSASATKATKARPFSKYGPDQTDQIYDLEKENTQLKSHQNLVEQEIRKMNTKLKRINDLLKKKQGAAGLASTMGVEAKKYLEDEINKINFENEAMKERNRKLKAIEKELSVHSLAKKAPTNKYAHVKGKLNQTKVKQSDVEYNKMIEELKVQLIQGEKKIIALTQQSDQISSKFNPSAQNDLSHELESQQKEMVDVNHKIAEIKSQIAREEALFRDSKSFIESKQSDIHQLNRDCENLAHDNLLISSKAETAKGLADDLQNMREERDQIEKGIAALVSYPFQKNTDGQVSAAQRAAELEDKLKKLNRVYQETHQEEMMKEEELSSLKNQVQRLIGETEQIKVQHKDARGKYSAANDHIQVDQVSKELRNMDKAKYTQAVDDLTNKPEELPIWKGYEFLERELKEKAPKEGDEEAQLIHEIKCLKHENGDFVAEIERIQNLLELQTDIEKENRLYLEQERQIVKNLAESNARTVEEMRKRVDGQEKLIKDTRIKLGLDKPDSGMDRRKIVENFKDSFQESPDSDFEVDETDRCLENENFVDLKVKEALIIREHIETLQRAQGEVLSSTDFTSIVMVDFFDHDSKVTQPGHGFNPDYNSTFSFKNKMDRFYVQELAKQRMHFDIYSAKPKGAKIHIGYCDVLLQDLVYGASIISDKIGSKPPLLKKELFILPTPGLQHLLPSTSNLGTLRIKLRLRKSILEALKYHKNMAEIQAAEGRFGQATQQVVEILIDSCKGLQGKGEPSRKLAPFFTYTFFDSDITSQFASGIDPIFSDKKQFTLNKDESTKKYFMTQDLEIQLIDDNAPQVGDEDEIGIAKIPLKLLSQGAEVDGEFDVMRDGRVVGRIYATITVRDLGEDSKFKEKVKAGDLLKWQEDIIMRIARKLADIQLDIPLMFGIFSRGSDACSMTDFKYNCLNRLNLKEDLEESDLDQFISSHSLLKKKNYITREDFVVIFTEFIKKAKAEVDRDAFDRQQMLRYNEMVRTQGESQQQTLGRQPSMAGSTFQRQPTIQEYQHQEVLTILGQSLKNVNYSMETYKRELNRISTNEKISVDQFQKSLQQMGGVSGWEANQVSKIAGKEDTIPRVTVEGLLEESRFKAKQNNASIQKFKDLLNAKPKVMVELFELKDINGDGQVNIDGFKSALIGCNCLDQFKLKVPELTEVFNLLSLDNNFYYALFFVELNSNYRSLLTKHKISDESARLAESSIMTLDHSQSISHTVGARVVASTPDLGGRHSGMSQQHPPASGPRISYAATTLSVAKQKIEQFIRVQNLTLHNMFQVIDSNSDKILTKSEFKQKFRGLQIGLCEEEIETLFRDLDVHGDGKIHEQEFIKQFARINVERIIERLRGVLAKNTISADYVFNRYCSAENTLRVDQFRALVKSIMDKLKDYEIDSVYAELMKETREDCISKALYLKWFGQDETERQTQTDIEDILKPLLTVMKRKGFTVSMMFDKYDRNKNDQMSAEEIQGAVKDLIEFTITSEEVRLLREFFEAKYRRKEIRKNELADLANKQSKRTYDKEEAKAAKVQLNKQLERQNQSIAPLLQQYSVGTPGEITLRQFKVAIYNLNCLTSQQVSNLAKYMDKHNNGLIRIEDMKLALDGDLFDPTSVSVGSSSQRQTRRQSSLRSGRSGFSK